MKRLFKIFWDYLKNHQTPQIRIFHLVVMLLVILQVLNSSLLSFTKNGAISASLIFYLGTWCHILLGLVLIPLAVIFVLLCFREHGFRSFYPYLFGNFTQIKSDLNHLRQFKLPDPEVGGLADSVQGLGLGALLLALFFGGCWYLAWSSHLPLAKNLRDLHGLFASLTQIYLFGHGTMALVHIYFKNRNARMQPNTTP